MSGRIKILITFSQIVSCFDVNFDVPWPSALIDVVISPLSIVNLDILQTVSVECIAEDFDYYHTLDFTFWYPIAGLALWRLVHEIKLRRRAKSSSSEEQGISSGEQPQQPAQLSYYEMLTQGYTQLVDAIIGPPRADYESSEHQVFVEDLKTQYWSYLLFGLFLVYPPITATILKVFHCREINGEWYLYADYRLKCDSSGQRQRALAFSVLGCIMYIVGIPAFFYTVLYVNRDALHFHSEKEKDNGHDRVLATTEQEHSSEWWPERWSLAIWGSQDGTHTMFRFRPETVHDRIGFLYEDYEREYSSHELMVLFKKFLLTGV